MKRLKLEYDFDHEVEHGWVFQEDLSDDVAKCFVPAIRIKALAIVVLLDEPVARLKDKSINGISPMFCFRAELSAVSAFGLTKQDAIKSEDEREQFRDTYRLERKARIEAARKFSAENNA